MIQTRDKHYRILYFPLRREALIIRRHCRDLRSKRSFNFHHEAVESFSGCAAWICRATALKVIWN
jgi:hypothetical protein